MTTGVLLMTYGAPSGDADLPRYLSAVRGGRPAEDALVAEMKRRYERIGGSPLIRITKEQAASLERELGTGYVAAAGMRFSPPSIGDAARQLVDRGADVLLGICMSPQWSPTLMGGYERELTGAASALGVPCVMAGAWYREPAFIASIAEKVGTALAERDSVVILTAHSLPKRVFDAEPDYIVQLKATGTLVAKAAGLRDGRWHWAYQSAGHTQEQWLRPDLVDLFPGIAAAGEREVLVVPVQFLADHLEVLYDLDVAAGQQARDAGLVYRRIEMPNTSPAFIRALADVAHGAERSLPVRA
ncbi:MAG TPA: ferrochelatase [Candidatus Limnocylindria bacterium]